MTEGSGLYEVANGVWAYLQSDGGWGWSNAGLVTSGDRSLVVDTLFDLRLTREMLGTMRRVTPAAARVETVVNTHANGDHWYGNSLLAGAEIVSPSRCAEEMAALPPSQLAALLRAVGDGGQLGTYLRRIFGSFSFEGVPAALPTRTFDGRLDLVVGDRPVSLIEVGPAHTAGDVIVHLPDAGVVFSGDILFKGSHPIVWHGPVANWIAACDRILALRPTTVVPGHGPLATPADVENQRGYFERLTVKARACFDAGLDPLQANHEIDLGPDAALREGERVVANIRALYRDFGDGAGAGSFEAFGDMAAQASPVDPGGSRPA